MKASQRRTIVLVFCSAISSFCAMRAHATPYFYIELNGIGGLPHLSSSTGVSGGLEKLSGVNEFGNFTIKRQFAVAEPGRLGTYDHAVDYFVDATQPRPAPASFVDTIDLTSEALAILDDFVITGGETGQIISTSFELRLSGGLSASSLAANGKRNAGAFSEIDLRAGPAYSIPGVNNPGPMFGTARFSHSTNAETLVGGSELTTTGVLDGYGGGTLRLMSPTYNLPVNVPFAIELRLRARARTDLARMGEPDPPELRIAEADASFSDTLSFAHGVPVFALPPGYTVNSASARIVNNFVVPEPGCDELLCLASVLAVGIRGPRTAKKPDRPPMRPVY